MLAELSRRRRAASRRGAVGSWAARAAHRRIAFFTPTRRRVFLNDEVAYPREDVFAVVADVCRYTEFLPFCAASRVITRHSAHSFDAELSLGFLAFTEQYVSRVEVRRGWSCSAVSRSSTSEAWPAAARRARARGPDCAVLRCAQLSPPSSIIATASDTPLFVHLTTGWRFDEGTTPGSCRLHFELDLLLRSMMHDQALAAVIERVAAQQVGAFKNRCDHLLGANHSSATKPWAATAAVSAAPPPPAERSVVARGESLRSATSSRTEDATLAAAAVTPPSTPPAANDASVDSHRRGATPPSASASTCASPAGAASAVRVRGREGGKPSSPASALKVRGLSKTRKDGYVSRTAAGGVRVLWQARPEWRRRVDAAFDAHAVSGRLSLSRFVEACRALEISHPGNEACRTTLAGTPSATAPPPATAPLGALPYGAGVGLQQDMLAAWFVNFDEDASGGVEREEFVRNFWMLTEASEDARMAYGFEKLDLNGSGALERDDLIVSPPSPPAG